MAVVATYTYKPGSEAGRQSAFDEHAAFIAELGAKVKLLAAGRINGPPFDILFLVQSDDPAAVKQLLAQDPFNAKGFIAAIEAYSWAPKRGSLVPI